MKKSITIILITVFLLSLSFIATAKELKKGKDGMYWQSHDSLGNTSLVYQVDTVCETCFAFQAYIGGIAVIPCENLAKRHEWKSIITWVNDNSDSKDVK